MKYLFYYFYYSVIIFMKKKLYIITDNNKKDLTYNNKKDFIICEKCRKFLGKNDNNNKIITWTKININNCFCNI